MTSVRTALSHNIKFLRKAMGISQEELAHILNIKRSNIAAYESKNVEPRLRIILEMSKVFDVDVSTLIETRLDESMEIQKFSKQEIAAPDMSLRIKNDQRDKVAKFIEKSFKIRKVLEGFKSFYAFRKKGITIDSPEKEKVIFDIDNFIQLMDHLLNYNDNVIAALNDLTSAEENSHS